MTALLITESRIFQGLSHKDKDQTLKDQNKDKDQTYKDLKLVLKESLRTRTRINITDVTCGLTAKKPDQLRAQHS